MLTFFPMHEHLCFIQNSGEAPVMEQLSQISIPGSKDLNDSAHWIEQPFAAKERASRLESSHCHSSPCCIHF